ncbi:hypothetical protein AVEN_204679-1 [Araneus ventricosus]|uniref:Uncharacterized protein n=1 Tax=Araneus ventricosus TaxID=182803 RepID=A0A4Y2KZE9_ARAVE|nr:hypothetical protein AVEN_204679-1 [Araneus ventricosus]
MYSWVSISTLDVREHSLHRIISTLDVRNESGLLPQVLFWSSDQFPNSFLVSPRSRHKSKKNEPDGLEIHWKENTISESVEKNRIVHIRSQSSFLGHFST